MLRPTLSRRVLLWVLTGSLLLMAIFVVSVLVTPLPTPTTAEATVVLDTFDRPFTRLFTQDRINIPMANMPKPLFNAIVAIEDDRFYKHKGIDPIGIARAMYRDIKAGKVVEGGSTLTQQLAKNLYTTQERTLTRKFKEAVLTVRLESVYTKPEILAMYWNTIYLGNGIYGVERAAETYFGKGAKGLTLAESALLAGLPREPEYYSPCKHPQAAQERRNLVLGKMAELGYITAAESATAAREPLYPVCGPVAGQEAPYLVDYLVTELKERFPDVAANLYQGGYTIRTTLDPRAQTIAARAVGVSPQGQHAEPQVALVAIEPTTGYIRALVGGRGTKPDRNRALEKYQPGSAFKPFVYATALASRRYTAASTQPDTPVSFPGAKTGQRWQPVNFNNQYSYQPTPMREALRRSLNVVTARWMDVLKPGPVIDMAQRMGIQSDIPGNLTIGLGSAAVTPLELTRAYAPFANGGYAVKPMLIAEVTDRDGTRVAQQRPERTQVLDPGVAFIITDMLKDVLKPGGTAGQLAGYLGGRPAAGKTGTTDQSVDAWFVGYTPDLVTGVWVGNDDRSPSTREGGTAAAPIWGTFVSGALAGRPMQDWSPPGNVVSVDVCAQSGLLANASCPAHPEWFLTGTAPTSVDPTIHWDRLLPGLPNLPWSPPGAGTPPPATGTPPPATGTPPPAGGPAA